MEQRYGSSSEDLLPVPIPGGPGLTTQQRQAVDHSARIRGWGSDLEPSRRPGVPRDKAPEIGGELLYPGIPPQVPRIRIHKSTEHGQLPPVFGTACPPRGLSGWIRDRAYKLSEGRASHWMTLMVADRVDVLEDVLREMAHGRVPNIAKEMGLRSEWKYNRKRVIRNAAIAGLCIGALVGLSRARKARSLRYR